MELLKRGRSPRKNEVLYTPVLNRSLHIFSEVGFGCYGLKIGMELLKRERSPRKNEVLYTPMLNRSTRPLAGNVVPVSI